jgi:hypothetical protein
MISVDPIIYIYTTNGPPLRQVNYFWDTIFVFHVFLRINTNCNTSQLWWLVTYHELVLK